MTSIIKWPAAQLTDIKHYGSILARTVLEQGDVEGEFNHLWQMFCRNHGIPFPSWAPDHMDYMSRFRAAQQNLMCSLLFYGRGYLRAESNRVTPVLESRVTALNDTIQSAMHLPPPSPMPCITGRYEFTRRTVNMPFDFGADFEPNADVPYLGIAMAGGSGAGQYSGRGASASADDDLIFAFDPLDAPRKRI